MAEDLSWIEEGNCQRQTFKDAAKRAGATRDPSMVFFPLDANPVDGIPWPQHVKKPLHIKATEQRFEQLARKTCSDCPVRLDCLFWTMSAESEPWGIAGGMSHESRADLLDTPNARLHTRICACGTRLFGTKGTVPEFCSDLCRPLEGK